MSVYSYVITDDKDHEILADNASMTKKYDTCCNALFGKQP